MSFNRRPESKFRLLATGREIVRCITIRLEPVSAQSVPSTLRASSSRVSISTYCPAGILLESISFASENEALLSS